MQTWITYRWRIFTFINCLYIAYEIGIVIYYQVFFYNHQGWINFFDHRWVVLWPEKILSLLTVLSLAVIMQYFKESNWKLASVYLYIAVILTLNFVAVHTISYGLRGALVFFPTLFFVIGLFNVQSPGVSANFKWVGGTYLLSILLIYLASIWRILHSPVGPSEATRLVLTLMPYIAILVLLLKMPMERVSSIDVDIETIGATPPEQDIYP